MPAQQSKSPLWSSALKKHAKAKLEPKTDFSELPGGITGGKARLTSLTLGTYKTGKNQGKQFFRAAATVISPKTAMEVKTIWDSEMNNGKGGIKIVSRQEVPVEGLFTSIMVPLCDTVVNGKDGQKTITANDHVGEMMQELKRIGGEDCTNDVEDEASLQALFDALVDAGPVIKFNTRSKDPNAQYPNGGTWGHEWFGAVAEDHEPDAGSGVQDDTGNDTKTAEPEPGEEDDLDALAEAADGGDGGAGEKIKAAAKEAGLDDEWVENGAENFAEVVQAIKDSVPGDAEPEAEPEPASVTPSEGEVYTYQQKDKNGKPVLDAKKKPKRPIDCEVVKVNKAKKTVDLLSQVDKKTVFKDVKWDDLITPE